MCVQWWGGFSGVYFDIPLAALSGLASKVSVKAARASSTFHKPHHQPPHEAITPPSHINMPSLLGKKFPGMVGMSIPRSNWRCEARQDKNLITNAYSIAARPMAPFYISGMSRTYERGGTS